MHFLVLQVWTIYLVTGKVSEPEWSGVIRMKLFTVRWVYISTVNLGRIVFYWCGIQSCLLWCNSYTC